MDKLLADIPYFVEVARRKSFTLAAETLDMPISSLSRRISGMEKKLGVQLFRRTTRNVELTESGVSFFERCSFVLAEVEQARDTLLREMQSPSGPVRVSMPQDIYHGFLHRVLSDFALQYPDIQMHVSFNSRWVDLTSEPFDVDLRVGELPDSNLRSRKLYSVYGAVYAAPQLFEFYPEPEDPEDLRGLPCIGTQHLSGGWTLCRGEEKRRIPLDFVHYLNSGGVQAEFLLAGLGVALMPPRMMLPFEKHGLARRCLPEWSAPSWDLHLVMPEGQQPYRVRLFIDYLVAHFASPEIHNTMDVEPLILAKLGKKISS